MEPKHRGGDRMLLAPGASSAASSLSFPSSDRHAPSWPRVDDHLVQPEVSHEEYIRGRKIVTMGSNPEHAEAHARMDFVIAPHVRQGAVAASDLLTRVNQGSNFATDVSVRKEGIDPQTGARYLEELSFEVVNEQSKRDVTDKAEDMVRRGVRRVFAIFVKKGYVGEWSQHRRDFVPFPKDGLIEDPMFIRPIPAQALFDAAVAESQVALALWQKGNPEIVRIHQKGLDEGHKKGLDEGHKKGLDEGHRLALIELLQEKFGPVPEDVEARIRCARADQVRSWTKSVLKASSMNDVFAGDGSKPA